MSARLPTLFACCWLLACSAAPPPGATPGATVGPRPEVTVVRELPAGSVLRLLPAAALTAGEFDAAFATALWREALRQTARFDVAAGLDDVRDLPQQPVLAVQLSADPTAQTLTATLETEGAPPLLVATASRAGRPLPAAIDELAWRCRLALGEDAPPPVPVAACYSGQPLCVQQAELALRRLGDGDFLGAANAAAAARRHDGGSPLVLELVAAAALLRADPAAARAVAEEALGYRQRLSPPTAHRLARSLLLARASQFPAQAAERDRELLLLAEVTAGERPHDPQVRFTRALALNLLERFAESAPLLRQLAVRLPRNALVHYHRGWAELALGEPAAAVAALQEASVALPRPITVLPLAVALYEAGEHARLAAFLQELLERAQAQGGSAVHELRRMQAAHALLQGQPQRAGDLLLADLTFLLQRPSLLDRQVGDLVADGEVLVRLGRAADLTAPLQALASLRLSGAVADAMAFLTGMQQVAKTGRRAEAIEAALARSGGIDSVWSQVLCAFGHRAAGELLDEYSALAHASRLGDGWLIKASMVRSLRATGRDQEATALAAALQRELHAVHLRQPLQHPLLGPELALASQVE